MRLPFGCGSSATWASASAISSRAARLGDVLPVAIEDRALERVQQVQARAEAGALDAHEGRERAHRLQVLERAHAGLAQPGHRLRADVAQLRGGHASDSTKIAASCSRPRWSSPSKRSGTGAVEVEHAQQRAAGVEQRHTSSEREAESQGMWPGKASTSATRCVCRVDAAVPHTPLPSAMRTQAGWPWKGPTTSSLPS
jgi:hypothetical protein